MVLQKVKYVLKNHLHATMDNSCTFYNKIGACRHGEKCSRQHIKPITSYTILLSNLYENPKLNKNNDELNPKQVQTNFDEFYRDIFVYFAQLGEIKSLVVCENENNHLNGNVYVRFKTREMAADATNALNLEWFNGRPVHCDLSPVDNFHEANCRAYETESCERDFCNFMHVRKPSEKVKKGLFDGQEKEILLRDLKALIGTQENEAVVEETVHEEASVEANVASVVEQLFA